MANEKDIKNDMNENVNDGKKESAAPAVSDLGFGNVDAFAWRDETEQKEQSGYETVYPNTGVMLQRRLEPGKDGKIYQNFAVAFNLVLNGKKQVQTAYFNPVQKTTPMFDLLAMIFGDNEYYPVEIVKTTTPKTDSRPERVNWSLRVAAEGEFGNKVVCNMTTIGRGDAMAFTNLVELLKARKVLE